MIRLIPIIRLPLTQPRRGGVADVAGDGAVLDPADCLIHREKRGKEPFPRHNGIAEAIPDFDIKPRHALSAVSTYGTKLTIRVTNDFWLIVTPRRVKMSQKSASPQPIPYVSRVLTSDKQPDFRRTCYQ